VQAAGGPAGGGCRHPQGGPSRGGGAAPDGVLEHQVRVRRGERAGWIERHLELAGSVLGLDRAHPQPGLAQSEAQFLHVGLDGWGVVQGEVERARADRAELAVLGDAVGGALEDGPLGLVADVRGQSVLGEQPDLVPQHLAGSDRDGVAGRVDGVGHDQGRGLPPGQDPQRVEVRPQHQVVQTGAQGGQGEVVVQVHVGVGGQHIAAQRPARGASLDAVQEGGGGQGLAPPRTGHVRQGQQDRVDGGVVDEVAKAFQGGARVRGHDLVPGILLGLGGGGHQTVPSAKSRSAALVLVVGGW